MGTSNSHQTESHSCDFCENEAIIEVEGYRFCALCAINVLPNVLINAELMVQGIDSER